ncbi:hypothetical protein LY78DRAFT_276849 [Colletotrichum sublineola]|nr:hypothetical protein LY78DRAFT_276849 [Colletotrichum sublineola]
MDGNGREAQTTDLSPAELDGVVLFSHARYSRKKFLLVQLPFAVLENFEKLRSPLLCGPTDKVCSGSRNSMAMISFFLLWVAQRSLKHVSHFPVTLFADQTAQRLWDAVQIQQLGINTWEDLEEGQLVISRSVEMTAARAGQGQVVETPYMRSGTVESRHSPRYFTSGRDGQYS